MKLSKEAQEKLTLGIQASLTIVIIGLSVINSARVESAAMKKAAKKEAKALAKLQTKEYKLQTKLMKEKYKGKIKAAKIARRAL